jgi:hypothetical protein
MKFNYILLKSFLAILLCTITLVTKSQIPFVELKPLIPASSQTSPPAQSSWVGQILEAFLYQLDFDMSVKRVDLVATNGGTTSGASTCAYANMRIALYDMKGKLLVKSLQAIQLIKAISPNTEHVSFWFNNLNLHRGYYYVAFFANNPTVQVPPCSAQFQVGALFLARNFVDHSGYCNNSTTARPYLRNSWTGPFDFPDNLPSDLVNVPCPADGHWQDNTWYTWFAGNFPVVYFYDKE